MERVMGIEPTLSAWKAEVLPLNYTRTSGCKTQKQKTQTYHSVTFAFSISIKL